MAAWKRYTVLAKSPESDVTLPENARHELMLKRLQALLRDRFHLVLIPEIGLVRQTGMWKIRAKGTPTTGQYQVYSWKQIS